MATSGVISGTEITVATLLDHAFRRAGLSPAMQTFDAVLAAKDNLYFYLSALSNDGVNLWTIEKVVKGIYSGQGIYNVGSGTVDVKNVLRRTLSNFPSGATAASSAGGTVANVFDRNLTTYCAQSSMNGNISASSSSDFTVETIGFMPNGNKTYNLYWEVSSDNVNWTTVYNEGKKDYSDKTWYCWDIEFPKPAKYFRVRESSGGIINFIELIFGTVISEIPVPRINIDQYTNLTNKTFGSNISQQYWLDRHLDDPKMNVWPVPNYAFDQFVVWRTRYIQDVGTLTNTIEVPQRWIDAIVTGLAGRLLLELPNVDSARYEILKKEEAAALYRAQQEEQDNSPIQLAPNISCYTR